MTTGNGTGPRLPYLNLYVDDFVAETALLDSDGVAMYVLVRCAAWRHNGVPDNPAALARVSRLPLATANRVWPEVQAVGFHLVDGRWHHTRDRQQVDEQRARSEHGRRGARARHGGIVRAGIEQAAGSGWATGEQGGEQCPNDAQGLHPSPSPEPTDKHPVAAAVVPSGQAPARDPGSSSNWLTAITKLPTELQDSVHRFIPLATESGASRYAWVQEIAAAIDRDGYAVEHVARALADILMLEPDRIRGIRPVYFRGCLRTAKREATEGAAPAPQSAVRSPQPSDGSLVFEGQQALARLREQVTTHTPPGQGTVRRLSRAVVQALGTAVVQAVDAVGGPGAIAECPPDKAGMVAAQFGKAYAQAVAAGAPRWQAVAQ